MIPSTVRIHQDPNLLLREFFRDREYTQVVVLMDTHTVTHCYPKVKDGLPAHQVILVEAGEEYKNLETCAHVWRQMTDFQLDRHAVVVVVGGGVLGDLGGFCAATYKRGIDFVLMPTTLLAQVDASVGGKLGIDFDHYKNHIGVFHLPQATLISPAFLSTLPLRELRSGYAEVVKHCLISDEDKWNQVRSRSLDQQDWQDLIEHSVAFKSGVVERDPREKGERKILNFGHTIGHAVESLSLGTDQRLFHGEAIAAGMILEAYIAQQKGMLTAGECQSIESNLVNVFGKITMPVFAEAISAMQQDKKNKGNKILMALPKGIGKAVWDLEVSEREIQEAWARYEAL